MKAELQFSIQRRNLQKLGIIRHSSSPTLLSDSHSISFKIIPATATTKRRKIIVFQNKNVPKFEVHIPPQKKFPNNVNRRNLHNTFTYQTQANAETNTKMERKLITVEQNPPFPTTVHVKKKKKKQQPIILIISVKTNQPFPGHERQ